MSDILQTVIKDLFMQHNFQVHLYFLFYIYIYIKQFQSEKQECFFFQSHYKFSVNNLRLKVSIKTLYLILKKFIISYKSTTKYVFPQKSDNILSQFNKMLKTSIFFGENLES